MLLSQILDVITSVRSHWRLRHDPIGYARSLGVMIGSDCRLVSLNHTTFGSEPYLVQLGNHVTVTAGVRFITHDGGVWIFRQQFPEIELFKAITVGDNVFIGANAIILPGVSIGSDCVIGAGAVVTRDVPPGTVAVGCPARPIKSKDDYWKSIATQASHTRGLPKHEKRMVLIERLISRSHSSTVDRMIPDKTVDRITTDTSQSVRESVADD